MLKDWRTQRLLQADPEELPLKVDDADSIRLALEHRLKEAGRIVSIHQEEDVWSVELEPWEEMRTRMVSRKGGPPMITSQVKATVVNGRLDVPRVPAATVEIRK